MQPEIRDSVMFTVTEGDQQKVRQKDLTDGEKQILLALAEHGHTMDAFFAYMAETYPLHVAAPEWRRSSATHNGVRIALMLNCIPNDPLWVNEIEERFVRHYGGEVTASVAPAAMALVMRLSGEDFLSFRVWIEFTEAARQPLKTKGGGTA
jgi:DNA segregation ATPase FtsK/SpoIIIE-like protein